MGLDMFAWCVKAEDALGELEIRSEDNGRTEPLSELFYWRKHHDLHGWMENLYRNKGGEAESFNCVPVRLNSADLDALYFDLEYRNLPETTGFFFGTNPPDDESVKRDFEFIAAARAAIADGMFVYYDSWW
jgi:hypothetical protein